MDALHPHGPGSEIGAGFHVPDFSGVVAAAQQLVGLAHSAMRKLTQLNNSMCCELVHLDLFSDELIWQASIFNGVTVCVRIQPTVLIVVLVVVLREIFVVAHICSPVDVLNLQLKIAHVNKSLLFFLMGLVTMYCGPDLGVLKLERLSRWKTSTDR